MSTFAPSKALSSASYILSELPALHYNNDRDDYDRLTSEDLRIEVALSESAKSLLAAGLEGRRASHARSDLLHSILSDNVFVEVVRFDGSPLHMYIPCSDGDGRMVIAPAPAVKFDARLSSAGCIPDTITLIVKREFPLSSAHGNAPMKLAIHVCGEIVTSASFMVAAKKGTGKSGPKHRRIPVAPAVSEARLARLAAVGAKLASPSHTAVKAAAGGAGGAAAARTASTSRSRGGPAGGVAKLSPAAASKKRKAADALPRVDSPTLTVRDELDREIHTAAAASASPHVELSSAIIARVGGLASCAQLPAPPQPSLDPYNLPNPFGTPLGTPLITSCGSPVLPLPPAALVGYASPLWLGCGFDNQGLPNNSNTNITIDSISARCDAADAGNCTPWGSFEGFGDACFISDVTPRPCADDDLQA